MGLQPSDARKKISAAQSPGFGEFSGGELAFASEGIGSRKAAAMCRYTGQGATCLFEPVDRLVGLRLQQMHGSNQEIERANERIARAEANGLLHERGHLVQRTEA